MKRKVLAIALSLALLTSMFVFAAPVGAVGESENANSFTIWFDNTSKPIPQPSTNIWFGKPVDVTLPDGRGGPLLTITVPGQFSILTHPWPFEGVGDFGPEIGYLSDADWEIDITAHINYNVPHVLGHWDWTITTDVGDLVISCETKRTTGWWLDTNPEDPRAWWPAVSDQGADYQWCIVEGTGAFEDMKGNGGYNSDLGRYEGIAHYNPRH